MSSASDQSPTKKRRGIAFHYDVADLKLAGWAAHENAEQAKLEISVRLMAGDVLLGRLRRDRARPDVDAHLGHSQPPCGFGVPDHGLRAFAEMVGLQDLAVVVESATAGSERHPLYAVDRGDVAASPLGTRHGVRGTVRLGDAWLAGTRDLTLRFDATEGASRSVDIYQCDMPGDGVLIKLAGDQPIGTLVSLAKSRLINPFLPVLMIFKGEDGAIDAIDLLPFPSLLRGGLHAAERAIVGDGGDELTDTATISATLLRALLRRSQQIDDHVGTIILDPTTHTGVEPMLNSDLLRWIAALVGVSVVMAPATAGDDVDVGFIAETLNRHASSEPGPGHRLFLPADAIPTLSALLQPLPSRLSAQRVVGSMAVVDWNRHGKIWSLWQPPLGDWLEGLQGESMRQTAPVLEVVGDGSGEANDAVVSLWPLAIILRQKPTRVARDSPYEVASELSAPLLRNRKRSDAVRLTAIVLCQRSNRSIAPLLESLLRQDDVENIDFVIVAPPGKLNSETASFLSSRLAERHTLVRQPPSLGRLEQLRAVRDHIATDLVVIADGAAILPDPRTLTTLLPMLDAPNVTTAGCKIRSGEGKSATQSGGYTPLGLNLRAMPTFAFGVIDPAVFRQPATYPVIANSMTFLVTTRAFIERMDARGSSSLRPEIDDVLLGIQSIEAGGLNLCSNIVAAYSNIPLPKTTDVSISIPYRLSADTLARLMSSTLVVQSF